MANLENYQLLCNLLERLNVVNVSSTNHVANVRSLIKKIKELKDDILANSLELSEEEVNDLMSSDKFVEDYNVYKKNIDVDKLRNFFDDIETNRNYFRLNIKKSKRFQNKNNWMV